MDRTELFVTAEQKLYYDVHLPDEMSRPLPLLIAVHGYGAHKRYMMREAKQVAGTNTVIASIEAPHPHFRQTEDGYRVGYGWIDERRAAESVALHQKFVLDVIASLDRDGLIDPQRIAMYGFSQACALNFRFAFTYPQVLAALIGVCGGIPGDLASNASYTNFSAKTLYIYGDDDEFYSNEQFANFETELRTRLANFTSEQFHAGHEITEEMRAAMRTFLKDAIGE